MYICIYVFFFFCFCFWVWAFDETKTSFYFEEEDNKSTTVPYVINYIFLGKGSRWAWQALYKCGPPSKFWGFGFRLKKRESGERWVMVFRLIIGLKIFGLESWDHNNSTWSEWPMDMTLELIDIGGLVHVVHVFLFAMNSFICDNFGPCLPRQGRILCLDSL
jgi:hypothetical protein